MDGEGERRLPRRAAGSHPQRHGNQGRGDDELFAQPSWRLIGSEGLLDSDGGEARGRAAVALQDGCETEQERPERAGNDGEGRRGVETIFREVGDTAGPRDGRARRIVDRDARPPHDFAR